MGFLSFYNNGIEGPLPDAVANLEGLFHLHASSNLLTDNIF